MGDCDDVCVLSGDRSEVAEYTGTRTIRMARKEHCCCECGCTIRRLMSYEVAWGKWDGVFEVFKTCHLCVEIREKFSCGRGWTFTDVWETLREDLFPRLRYECLNGLSIPSKEKVLQDWRRWKGLEASRGEMPA